MLEFLECFYHFSDSFMDKIASCKTNPLKKGCVLNTTLFFNGSIELVYH